MKAKRATRPYYDDRTLYLVCLPLWAEMYVSGAWSLERFEAHADRMREALFPLQPARP